MKTGSRHFASAVVTAAVNFARCVGPSHTITAHDALDVSMSRFRIFGCYAACRPIGGGHSLKLTSLSDFPVLLEKYRELLTASWLNLITYPISGGT